MLSTPYGEDAIRAATEADAAAQNASTSTHVHSIINSVVEKHSAIWAEEFSSSVSSMKLIHQRRVSLMAAEIYDTVSSLMHNHQTNVDDSSSKVQDQLHPFSLKKKKKEKRKRLRPFIASEHQVSHPDPHVASECLVPEATINSTDGQQNQANDNIEGLISEDIVNVPSPIEGQSPNFSTGIHAVVSDNPSHRDNIAATTPADANLNGGLSKSKRRRLNKKRKRQELEKKQFLFCRPSFNPMLLRRRTMVHMSEAGDPLNSLPVPILADILGRVADIGDIAACRLASRALLAATYQCPSVRLDAATHARCLRKGGVGVEGTDFCELMGNLASLIGAHLRSISIDVSKGQGCPDEAMWVDEGEFDEADDLHLTNGESVQAWAATAAGPTLQEVEITDFWPQSCWRKADALPVISHFCHNLFKLCLRNAWLSVDGLKIMPNLTHLTFEFIRFDDEDLSKLNECFPCLRILSLIRVEGLKNPRIHLYRLKTFCWEVSNGPRSLAIHAPNLVYLELKCVRPEILILDTPSLSTLKLAIDKLGPTVQVDGMVSLSNLRIESSDLNSLLQLFTERGQDIRTLDLELPVSADYLDLYDVVKPEYLLQLFARIPEVKLSPRFSCELMTFLSFFTGAESRSRLKKLLVHLPASDRTDCPVYPLLKSCAPSCKVTSFPC